MHTVFVRGAPVWIAICIAGCVGTNPRWDGSDGDTAPDPRVTDEGSDANDGGASDTHAVESSSESGAETTGDPASGSTSAAASSEGGPTCEEGQAICAGECKNIDDDKRACGIDCIDCTEMFDKDARCRDGECEPEDD